MARKNPVGPDLPDGLSDAIANMSPLELQELMAQFGISVVGPGAPPPSGGRGLYGFTPPPRPDLRRPRRSSPVILRVRVDLKGATPPIWRRLELSSDLELATVHQIIQACFGWWDYHLHRFSIGGDPFAWDAQVFVCEEDAEHSDDEPDGLLDRDVRLDETMSVPGDVLQYVYDYGDHWDLSIRLEAIVPITDQPRARCITGRRAGPPEDCGSVRDGDELATLLDDPAAFDVEMVNAAIDEIIDDADRPRLRTELELSFRRMDPSLVGVFVEAGLGLDPDLRPDPAEVADRLRPFLHLLDRCRPNGLQLTTAGWLPPVVVEEVAALLPTAAEWIGKKNREDLTPPVHIFRGLLTRLGLVRKFKGKLILTKAGKGATDPERLWRVLGDKLASLSPSEPEVLGILLRALLLVGPDRSDGSAAEVVARALTSMGWSEGAGPIRPQTVDDIWDPARRLLAELSRKPVRGWQPDPSDPVVRALLTDVVLGLV
ncbi:hypothetical protein GIS00_25465 [Nakamurella sp. YIM 132087]|uniref:Plasmid pRiA4b Orf3-like domain-containing protein n=1 Tax=Nakamurella alba TaxID=2665158 RepID=A0A7K1FSZ8_9ACTN|nr:plasmid pRiA4b ORF-3 family protein [Nakamurella alba]MTD17285.1 hypothetical protein [Nakamurella alba]